MATHVRNPVQRDVTGTKVSITVPAAERDKFVREFTENHRRKGRAVRIEQECTIAGWRVNSQVVIDLLALKRAMAKIAYGALYEYLGDQYLNDPLVAEWQKMLFSTDPGEVRGCKIHGTAFDTHPVVLQAMFPPLEPHQHAVAVANMQHSGPVVAVSLFGGGLHSLVMLASETSNYGLDAMEGKIAICDAKAAKTSFLDFQQHFIDAAN